MPDTDEAQAGRIRETVARYQETFSAGDRAGWLALFVEDGVLEDPVGTHRCQGTEALAAFWDRIHAGGRHASVVPVSGPAVCGTEAAWAFEVHADGGDVEHVISVIDVARFAQDGRILHNRAFWDRSTARTVPRVPQAPTP